VFLQQKTPKALLTKCFRGLFCWPTRALCVGGNSLIINIKLCQEKQCSRIVVILLTAKYRDSISFYCFYKNTSLFVY
jgi:hypothetical protein